MTGEVGAAPQPPRARRREASPLGDPGFHDAVTGLVSAALFRDRLGVETLRRHGAGRIAAVLRLTLDLAARGVRAESPEGVLVLRFVAVRLRAAVRPGDTVARVGDDSFAVLCDQLGDPGEAVAVGHRLVEATSAPLRIGARELRLHPGVGAALVDQGSDPASVLAAAEFAAARAREMGTGVVVLFDSGLRAAADAHRALTEGLERAADHGELRLHFQPELDLRTGHIAAVEALLRWQPDDGELLYPADFLDAAVGTGSIAPIGGWVLCEAVAQADSWRSLLRGRAPSVAVNLSEAELLDPGLGHRLAVALGSSGRQGEGAPLRLEVPDAALTADRVPLLRSLCDRGVEICIDGADPEAAAARARRFPVSAVKVTVPPGGAAELAGVVDVAHRHGVAVIAKGAEDDGQVAAAHAAGVDRVQGRAVAPPLDPRSATRLLINPGPLLRRWAWARSASPLA